MKTRIRQGRQYVSMVKNGENGQNQGRWCSATMLVRFIDSKWTLVIALMLTTYHLTMNPILLNKASAHRLALMSAIAETATDQPILRPAIVKPTEPPEKNRLLLAWTPLSTHKQLWGIDEKTFGRCRYTNCEITSNRSRLEEADLLLFRIRELKKISSAVPYRPYVWPIDKSDMPTSHKAGQMWMEVNEESPVHSHASAELEFLDDAFNLSVNYLMDSDYSLSPIPDVRLKKRPRTGRGTYNFAGGKTKMALWYVSHCNATSGRDRYVQELKKYNITVDIFGKCYKKLDGCDWGNNTCISKVRNQYKFYLAFENSICYEYITEKYWSTLQSTSFFNIPIALGASLHQYEVYSPPNSYLHTRNFTSAKALAEFMHKLDKNDTLYNSYFDWRYTHDIVPHGNRRDFRCFICQAANEKIDGDERFKMRSKYWNLGDCQQQPEPIG